MPCLREMRCDVTRKTNLLLRGSILPELLCFEMLSRGFCCFFFRAEAMFQIQDSLRNKKAAEGMALLRAAR